MKVDQEMLLSLWNDSCAFDILTPALLREKTIGDVDFDESLLRVAVRDERPVGFIAGVIRRREESVTGYIKMLTIDVAFRDRKIATGLLADLENEFQAAGVSSVRLGESAPNYLTPGLDPRYTSAMVFFERRGFERIGDTTNLTVDLDNLPPHPLVRDDSFEVRRATVSDAPAVRHFLNIEWPAWIPEVSSAFNNDPVSLHIALKAGQIVAFSAYDCNNVGTGWFGPMGTALEARGVGIGAEMLLRCLADLKRQGLARATIPWVGPIGFYSRFADAQVSRIFYRYEKKLIA